MVLRAAEMIAGLVFNSVFTVQIRETAICLTSFVTIVFIPPSVITHKTSHVIA